ncbi:MAG: hypothetical protein QMD08_05845 [Actinomycetota bacterium]|nr:hypothetical protein [Actinomycetota bacterium]
MVSGTELEVLKIVQKRGGETNLFGVASELKMSTDYAKIICRSLGMADYLDLFSSGKVRLTPKGERVLEKKTSPGEEEKAPQSPEEKFRRWTSK